MKMEYVKPRMIVERFTLTQSIASGCSAAGSSLGEAFGLTDKASCAWDHGGILFFLNGIEICRDVQVVDDSDLEGFCYNNPSGSVIFNS